MKYVTRINLKSGTSNRAELINFCLNSENQNLAIGWSRIYRDKQVENFLEYYQLVKSDSKRINTVLNILKDANVDDLFWTRDLDGNYWICRAKGGAQIHCNNDLDIGALLPVEAYKVGLQVPGQIKAAFNRANGRTAQRIYDAIIIEYSKDMFNRLSNKKYYKITALEGNFLDNLPDFDLEELVISYIQLKYDYYVLSNSIAKNQLR